jgi:adenylate kinase
LGAHSASEAATTGDSQIQDFEPTSPDTRQVGPQSANRRVIIVGIPGVGKSTIVNKIVDLLRERKQDVEVVNFGTTMMQEAVTRHGLKSRDEMRRLPVEEQKILQVYAARHISAIEKPFVIIDTHLFIVTKEGFWPGMPMDVLEELRPTHIVFISAEISEIKSRRENDTTRARDVASLESLQHEMDVARSYLFASSLVCGCPALTVSNSTGKSDEAAKSIISAIFLT